MPVSWCPCQQRPVEVDSNLCHLCSAGEVPSSTIQLAAQLLVMELSAEDLRPDPEEIEEPLEVQLSLSTTQRLPAEELLRVEEAGKLPTPGPGELTRRDIFILVACVILNLVVGLMCGWMLKGMIG